MFSNGGLTCSLCEHAFSTTLKTRKYHIIKRVEARLYTLKVEKFASAILIK